MRCAIKKYAIFLFLDQGRDFETMVNLKTMMPALKLLLSFFCVSFMMQGIGKIVSFFARVS